MNVDMPGECFTPEATRSIELGMKARKLLMVVLSMLSGGLLALVLLLLVCFFIDIAQTAISSAKYSDTAVSPPGDGSFGSSAAILLIFFGPFVFLAGAIALSFPVYFVLFKSAFASSVPGGYQLLASVATFCLIGGATTTYLEGNFIQGAFFGGLFGILLGVPVIGLRSVNRKR
ncbi:hypothetical protein LDO26_03065 [Luteimonas sp. BDR2-5]|uniref:hypothetical protein n=1 Tax=Proluteimonas luteida TaxID=2878685 RepID=UPI001E48DC98|nr:hypothetical protein [Luteimonas sp. BDR2-5]MCD9027194.1 hypothetical protein [Luteimonas sp. BDR2-5]